MDLPVLWFTLIAILFTGFFFLEGFDFGVGMSTRLIAKNKHERHQLMSTIGPFWDANEVWLITAGGALFAAFPNWYATMFSGYYTLFVVFLLVLIARGVAIEYSHHAQTDKTVNYWNWLIFISSALAPFLLGVLFTSLVQGMPIDADMHLYGQFTDYVNLYSIVGGVSVMLLSLVHGLTFIGIRTEGDVRIRAKKYLSNLFIILLAGEIIFAALTYTSTDFFTVRPLATPILLTITFVCTIFAWLWSTKKRERLAFIMTGIAFTSVIVMLFVGLFPRVMISSIDPAYNLTITNAASGAYTLSVMTKVAVTLLPFVLGYQIWSYYVFRKRIRPLN